MSHKFLRGAKNARIVFLYWWIFTGIAMTLTFFLLNNRGTLNLFWLNTQPILQNFPNKGGVKTQISRLFTLTSLARKSFVGAFCRLWCNSACASGSQRSWLARRTVKANRKAISSRELRLWTAHYYNGSDERYNWSAEYVSLRLACLWIVPGEFVCRLYFALRLHFFCSWPLFFFFPPPPYDTDDGK